MDGADLYAGVICRQDNPPIPHGQGRGFAGKRARDQKPRGSGRGGGAEGFKLKKNLST
jgi:hypothetical protein